LQQQARAFALAADIGIHFQLMECPPRDRHHADDRYAEREGDRKHVLCRNAVTAERQRAADGGGEGDHPGHCALRDDHEAEARHAHSRHHGCGDHLGARIEAWEKVERQPEERRGTDHNLAN
jgi:hypothetical protein